MSINDLTDNEIRQIAAMRAAGISQARVSTFFGVRQPYLSLIENGDPYARARAIYQEARLK
jgi:transcriptional regulator with XRE-family HTH domain